MIKAKTKKVTGCRNCHLAKLVDEDNAIYNKPFKLKNLEEIKFTDKFKEGSNYADNIQNIYVKYVSVSDASLTFSHVLKKYIAEIMGKRYSDGEMETTADDIQNKYAVMYEKTYSDGSSDYIVYYNVKLAVDEDSAKSETDSIEFQSVSLSGEASPLPNSKVKFEIASDETNQNSTVKEKIENFFNAVQFFGDNVNHENKTVTYEATGTVTDISISTIIYNKIDKQFEEIPSTVKQFTFKDDETEKTATFENDIWTIN